MSLKKQKEGQSSSSALLNKDLQMKRAGFGPAAIVVFILVTLSAFLLCICVGSVGVPLKETLAVFKGVVTGNSTANETNITIIMSVRLPRVLCVMLIGAALSAAGAAMQGLLKNPLADGSTLGVSSGASLGAVTAIVFGITLPGLPIAGTMLLAILFAFVSLVGILALAHKIDRAISTNTIILLGIIFSMFINSVISLIYVMFPDRVRSITFWTMGSLAGSSYVNALMLFIAFVICGGIIISRSNELNAFAIGEDNARHIGVDVKKTRLTILVAVSILVGICVSIGGTIAFVGLVTPHVVRLITGPNHKKLIPASMFSGAVFLMLADLAARTLSAPKELPIGAITSLAGAVVFVFIFASSRRKR